MSQISLGQCAILTSSQMITDKFRRSMSLEDYFHLGDRMVHPVLYIKDNAVVVDTALVKIISKWYISALKIISYISVIIPLIVGVLVLIKRRTTIVQTHLDTLLIIDPRKCLQKLNEEKSRLSSLGISSDQWETAICDWNPHTRTIEQQRDFESCVDFLISHNLVREEILLKKAVNQHKSSCCVRLLLERGNINGQIQQQSLQEALQCNHVDIVLALCNLDIQRTAELFFNKFNGLDENEMRRQWTVLFRLNPIGIVDDIKDPFVQSFTDETQRENIHRILTEVRDDCLQWLPHVSQYDKPIDLGRIQNAYQKHDDGALAAVEKDRAYGLRCFNWVNQLLTLYRGNQNREPQDDKYRQLPSGLNGERTVAWFTEQVAIFRNLARQGNSVQLRNPTTSYQTPIPGERYRWGYTLMNENLSLHHSCPIFYKNEILSSVELSRWHHGRKSFSLTWPDIEDQFKISMTTNPADNPRQFYRSLIKLVWLIGNTTPLTRGTGSVVESMWAFVHRFWTLPVPILKKGCPQLDVINISSSLHHYQDSWFRYFDPPSLLPAFQAS